MDEELETIECPWCHAEQDPAQGHLGELGGLVYYRCRYCGGQWGQASGEPEENS